MIQPPDGFKPMPNVGSQLERALAAWFVVCGICKAADNFVTNDNRERTFPMNEIIAHKSTEIPHHSRVESFMVVVACEFPAAQVEGQPAAWSWQQINVWVGNVMAALSITDNGGQDYRATCKAITDAGRNLAVDQSSGSDPLEVQFAKDNADMANFTCMYLRFTGSVRAKQSSKGVQFVEERNFEIHACPYSIPDFLP